MARRRRRAGPIIRRIRRARHGMRLNRIGARFISGGKHQTFKSIITSPWHKKTITNKSNRRTQYQAHRKRERAAAQKEKRRQQREAAKARKQAAAAKKAAPRPPSKRTPSTPIAVNPRTGAPITLREAMRSLKEATDRAEWIAAGNTGDPPAKKTAPRKSAAAKKVPARKAAAKKSAAKNAPPAPPLPPLSAPGKNLRGLYLAATCPCQGTGRIYTERNGRVSGSVSCPEHGRTARGGRRIFSRRAMTDSGLPGVAGWLDTRYRQPSGNMDRKQERAVRQAGRGRYAGPTVPCGQCDEGIVNRALTDRQREIYLGKAIDKYQELERKIPSRRSLNAAASRAYPYDRCRVCKGLGVVPDEHAGEWLGRTGLRAAHRPTARELATGRRTPGQRT